MNFSFFLDDLFFVLPAAARLHHDFFFFFIDNQKNQWFSWQLGRQMRENKQNKSRPTPQK